MDEEWRRRFRDEVLPELSFRFDLDASTLEVVQDHRNLVYEGSSVLGKVVLKTIPSAESHHNLLLGDLDWITHLHSNGVRVPRPLTSRDGHLVETVVAGGRSFSACCYQRIKGPLWQQVHNRSDLIGAVGQLAGKMHAVSAGYVPGWEGAIRPTWTDSPWFASLSDAIHPSMPAVIERCLELREALSNLPTSDYGIVHNDLHGGNIIISPDGPVAIDFECSAYSWLVSEIASALFFWLWKTPESQPHELAHRAATFLQAFMQGYTKEHSLGAGWFEAVPLFLKARELSMLASSPLAAEDFETHGKHDRAFSWMKGNIESEVPYVELDFAPF